MSMIEPIAQLVGQLSRLPGIGHKSAQRLAFHILEMKDEDAQRLAASIVYAKENTRICRVCGNYAQGELCEICQSSSRDGGVICVVRDARDVYAIERMREYDGLYHVLGGTMSPMDDKGPDDIRIAELLDRLDGVREVILATNPDIEGESTASYIAHLMRDKPIEVTRIALGVPVGGDLDNADDATLARAILGRRSL